MEVLEFCVEKCYFWCHYLPCWTLKLHSCVDLAHVYGYNSDCGSFRDCVVSHCVQLCSLYSFSFFVFSFRVAFVANKGIYNIPS